MAKLGSLFEEFVKRVLLKIGFFDVIPDGTIVFNGPNGKMVHGIGQPHNTDVLVEPPMHPPFYFKTRLIVECKDYNSPVGLDIIRSVLGMRDDINRLEMVDINILNQRQNMRRRTKAVVPFDNYLYFMAVATSSRFTMAAQEFALAHRIALITFDYFPGFKYLMEKIISVEKDYSRLDYQVDINKIKEDRWISLINVYGEIAINGSIYNLEDYMNNIGMMMSDKGIAIFLYKTNSEFNENINEDEYEIYYSSDNRNNWEIRLRHGYYNFVLPTIYQDILRYNESNRENYQARDLKTEYFNCVTIYTHMNKPKIISLSPGFVDKMYRKHRG